MIREISSLGFSSKKQTEIEAKEGEMKERIEESLQNRFRPEFLNRIDEIIIFHNLSKDDIRKIVELQILRLSDRLRAKNLTIKVSSSAKNLLAEKGYDLNFGARPLKRVIQQHILDNLSSLIVNNKVKNGQTVLVEADKDNLLVKTK